ncbi:hypothetical protein [Streptomyces sp. HNM0574]|uniref:hypothetical protein n=1 Tax=Streptomyces sp. HNM0574 TaxID=2714954 RepID=UPI00146DC659|nr:hypothetical protein [Streptomyces sp. HNM0574]NLU66634.1 hypothetical protein [Streptomyces sp. HNM0574]
MRRNVARAAATLALGLGALAPMSGVATAHDYDIDRGHGFIGCAGSGHNVGGPNGISTGGAACGAAGGFSSVETD